MNDNTALDLREVFARPWSGPVSVRRLWWLRWLPVASPTHFRTEISDTHLAETTGLIVQDTRTFANGKTWRRTMTARLMGPGHWRVSAKDMPGGAEQWVTADGFEFTPYTILVPVLRSIRIPLRCSDQIKFLDATTIIDRVEMTFLRIHVGTLIMRLSMN